MGRAGGAGAGTSTAERSRHRTARIAMAAERKVWLPIRYHMWWVRRLLRGARGPERRLTGGRARRRGYRVAARARCCLSPASRFRPDSRDRVPFVYLLYRPSPCWLLVLPRSSRGARRGARGPGRPALSPSRRLACPKDVKKRNTYFNDSVETRHSPERSVAHRTHIRCGCVRVCRGC